MAMGPGSSVSVPKAISIRSKASAASRESSPLSSLSSREHEPPDAFGNDAAEELGLGRDEPIEGLGRHAGALSDVGDAGRGIAVRLEFLAGRLDDELRG